ncbi:hypothetical protein [Dyella tabacisoli]|uniref:Uncharacterized protein n=1 Tax=Dyella tabacisoli TaxID=2282381 RepID=A0A369UPZ1_9GAMM|nr:hypothetical protein [Dyella tabacisoli]RDD82601.1 hypothetical protein DVJ77_06675 [Dyella tabacisoli]
MAYNKMSRRVNLGAVARALFTALQWRLLLLWLVLLLLPAAVVALPIWKALSGLLDSSVHADAWAQKFDTNMFGDTMRTWGDLSSMFGANVMLGLVLTLALAPWLNGMVIASGRAGRTLGFGQLLQGGLVEYGRMFRLMLWSLLPFAIAIGLSTLGFNMADERIEAAVLKSQADASQQAALLAAGVLFVLLHAVVESARAAFIADTGLRSATRALWRGFMQLLRRPFSTLFAYLLVSAIGYLAVLALGMARIQVPAIGLGGFVAAFLLSQLIVVALGWTRTARLFALAEVSRSLTSSRL